MSTAARVATAVALLLCAVAAVLAFVLASMDWNRLKGETEALASKAAGREVQIRDLDVDLGRPVRLRLSGIRVANPEWARAEHIASIESLLLSVRVLPLLWGELQFPEVILHRPRLSLEKDPDGRVNWALGAPAEEAAEVAAPEERTEVPRIDRIVIRDGQVSYREPRRELELDGAVSTATGGTGDELRLELEGRLEGRPTRLNIEGGSLHTLREEENSPFPLRAVLEVGETRVRVQGSARAPLRLAGLEARLQIQGRSLADVFHIYGTPLPPTPPYRLEGTLRRDAAAWRLEDFTGRIGDSEIRGHLVLDTGRERPRLTARLTSDRLDLRDLGGIIGLDRAPEIPRPRLFPDQPLATARLKDMDMDVRLTSRRINTPPLPLRAVDIRFRLEDGVLRIDPFLFSAMQGEFGGSVRVDAKAHPMRAGARVAVRGLGLGPFFEGSRYMRYTRGRFFGAVRLEGEGRSVAELMGSASGRAEIGMSEGSVSGLALEALNLDLIDALALAIKGGTPVHIRCAVIHADVRDGNLDLARAFIDTPDSVVVADGNADLATETVRMQVEAREKDFDLIDASAPISVTGTFKNLSWAIEDLALPFFEMGKGKDRDCRAQLAALKAHPLESKKLRPGAESGTAP